MKAPTSLKLQVAEVGVGIGVLVGMGVGLTVVPEQAVNKQTMSKSGIFFIYFLQ